MAKNPLLTLPPELRDAVWHAHRSLPVRRQAPRQKVVVGEYKLFITEGLYPDGTLGELSLKIAKEGNLLGALLDSFAISVSLGLQHGVPLERFVDTYVFSRCDPCGPVQGHPRIKNCTSLLDLVFRHLAIEYLGREDLAHVPPPEPSDQTELGDPEEDDGEG